MNHIYSHVYTSFGVTTYPQFFYRSGSVFKPECETVIEINLENTKRTITTVLCMCNELRLCTHWTFLHVLLCVYAQMCCFIYCTVCTLLMSNSEINKELSTYCTVCVTDVLCGYICAPSAISIIASLLNLSLATTNSLA